MKHIVIPADHVFLASMPRFDTEADAIAAASTRAQDNPGTEYIILAIVAGAATEKPAKIILPAIVTRKDK